MTDAERSRIVEERRVAGLSERITDPVALARVAALLDVKTAGAAIGTPVTAPSSRPPTPEAA